MYCLVTYVELIYELSLTLKRTIDCVCIAFLSKYMPIIVNFAIGGGHVAFLYNHWAEKMETVFMFIYGMYIGGKNIHSKST